jgi:hypothetical protein
MPEAKLGPHRARLQLRVDLDRLAPGPSKKRDDEATVIHTELHEERRPVGFPVEKHNRLFWLCLAAAAWQSFSVLPCTSSHRQSSKLNRQRRSRSKADAITRDTRLPWMPNPTARKARGPDAAKPPPPYQGLCLSVS